MQYPKSTQPLPEHAKKVFEGILFSVWQWEQKMFDGSVATFEKVSRNSSVGIFAFTKDKKIILTVQEQPGIQQFVSLVGGIVDQGEDVLESAHRELLEETGCVTRDIEFWYSVQPVTKVEWPVYMFVARNCEQVAPLKLDAGEKIQLQFASWDEFLQIIHKDEFRDKEVALKLLRLKDNPEKLKELEKFLFRE
ncbi:NUDIX hydrolase [Candidatus Woesebacteria bacterium]|nr:NUDIX hydrolase [Candidatus Woesebacteria bacterium]